MKLYKVYADGKHYLMLAESKKEIKKLCKVMKVEADVVTEQKEFVNGCVWFDGAGNYN